MSEIQFNNRQEDFALVIWGTGIGCNVVRFDENGRFRLQKSRLNFHAIAKEVKLEGQVFPGYLEYHCGGKHIAARFGVPIGELSNVDWELLLDDMADGLMNLYKLTSIKNIVITGGMILHNQDKLPGLRAKMNEKKLHLPMPSLEIAKFGDNAGMYGVLGGLKEV